MIVPTGPRRSTRWNEVRDVARSGFASLALRVAGLASTFALGVVLARVLGPAEFGLYGLVTTLAALAMSIALLGTPQLAVREFSVRKENGDWAGIRSLFRRFALATVLASLVISIGAILVGLLWSDGETRSLSLILPGAGLLPFMAITALIAAELRGLGQLAKGQVMDIFVRPSLAFLITISVVLTGASLTAPTALWIQVAVALFAALISVIWIRQALRAHPSAAKAATLTPWLAAALPLGAVDLLRQLDGAYGVVLMGWLESDRALGLFRVAIACNVAVAMPVTILHIILAPRLGPLHKGGRKDELQALLARTSAGLVAAVLPIALAAGTIGKPAIELVFGPEYGEAWLPLFLLCLAQLVFGIFGMGPILLAMCEGEKQLIRIYALAVGIGIVAAIPLVMWAGAAGAASAMIVSNGLIGYLSWRWGRSRLGVDSTFLPLLRPAS